MSEQERLQRVIDILTEEARGMATCEELNPSSIRDVAHKITAIFQSAQKDTRSRRECALDAEFERMGVKLRIYYFTDIPTFKAITIATIAKEDSYVKVHTYVLVHYLLNVEPATYLFARLRDIGIYGIAICNESSIFSRRYGRMKAKGKLWQHLLKEQKK